MRKAYILQSKTLDEIYAAYDNFKLNVIDETEMETWIGYLRAVGPHPMLLATIYHWEESHYMTLDFARFLRDRMVFNRTYIAGKLTSGPFYLNDQHLTSEDVIRSIYPDFYFGVFFRNLPQKSGETLKHEEESK